jgi:hypothetical protein
VTSGYSAMRFAFFTRLLIEGCAGLAVYQMGGGGFGQNILNLADIFTAELSALFTTLQHIAEVIRPPERCFLLTDSLRSIKDMLFRRIVHRAHPLVYVNNCAGACARTESW